MKKHTLSVFGLLVVLLSAPLYAVTQPDKPNIVFMLTDNLGYGELGVYGGGILRGAPTPRIDGLPRRHAHAQFQRRGSVHASRSALMTGRFSIRSGTYEASRSGASRRCDAVGGHYRGAAIGARLRHGNVGQMASRQRRERLPTHLGFDEWYGIPRTYDEAMWPSLNDANGMWPSVGDKQGWNTKVVRPAHLRGAQG